MAEPNPTRLPKIDLLPFAATIVHYPSRNPVPAEASLRPLKAAASTSTR
jgi:hypothetical protein